MNQYLCSSPYLQSYPFFMADRNVDVLVEILLGLPFKRIAKWLSVSYFWIKKVQSHSFSKLHLKKSQETDRDRCVLPSTAGSTPTQFYKADFEENDEMFKRPRSISQPPSHPTIQTKVGGGHANGLVCTRNKRKWSCLKKSKEIRRDRCVLLSTVGSTPTRFYRVDFDEDDDMIERPRSIPQPLSHPTIETRVVGHANGLICIRNEPKWRFGAEMAMWNARIDSKLAIWNPSIDRFKIVPTLPVFTIATLSWYMHRYPPVYGFAYNSEMNDHEIIRINQFEDRLYRTFTSEVSVWTYRTNKWRRISGLPVRYSSYEVGMGFSEFNPEKCSVLNDHVHWLMEKIPDYSWRILAFDIKEEEFSDIALPEHVEPNVALRLEALDGFLYLVDHQAYFVNVWRMNEYQNADSWSWFYVIQYGREQIYSLFPVISSKTGRGILNLCRSEHSCLFWLNLNPDNQTNPTEVVVDLGDDKDLRSTYFLENFLLAGGDRTRP